MTAEELIAERDLVKAEVKKRFDNAEKAKNRLVQAVFEKIRDSNIESFLAGRLNEAGEYTLLISFRVLRYRSIQGKAIFNLAWHSIISIPEDDSFTLVPKQSYAADSSRVIAAVSPSYHRMLCMNTKLLPAIEQLVHEQRVGEERKCHMKRLTLMFGPGSEEEDNILQDWRDSVAKHDASFANLGRIELSLYEYTKARNSERKVAESNGVTDPVYKIGQRLFMFSREFNIITVKEIGVEIAVVNVE